MAKWIEDARSLREDDCIILLAGNKSDISQQHRQVSTTEAQVFASERNLLFFEISAKEGTNITETFNEVAKKLTGTVINPIVKSNITNQGFSLEPPAN